MRILIAEDSQTQAVDLRRRLEAAGHTVVVAADGLQAWNLLRARPEPLVISDWMMPELNGLELCRKIRAEISSPYIYFILLTAKSHRHERLQGLSAGADDFLTKPVDSVELDIALRTAQRIIAAQESLKTRASELERKNQELSQLSLLDPLTGLRSAMSFQETLASACLQAAAEHRPLALVRLELHGFEWLAAGPEPSDVLVRVAHLIRERASKAEIVSRHGDHGFALVFFGLSLHEARNQAEALRSAVSEWLEQTPGLSASAGAAAWTPGPDLVHPSTLLDACEAELLMFPR